MDNAKERDEFERISLYQENERSREMLARYEEGMAFYRKWIEKNMHKLGRLDERLGEGS